MKKLINLFGLILMIILVLISINSLSGNESNSDETARNNFTATVTSNPDEFIVGAYHIGCTDLNRLQELGLNMWHRFLAQHDQIVPGMNQTRFPMGFTTNDSLFKSIYSYQSEAVGYYNSVSQLNNNYLYLTRPKIEMLSFAQRSDYHPFALNLHQQSIKGKWWYGYNTIGTGEELTDGNINVRKCSAGVDSAGYVLKDLRPSWEQVKGDIPNNFFNDGQYSWYIRPKVKIHDSTPPGTQVFRVEIYKKDGMLLKNIEITRDDFGFPYSGDYIDSFSVKWNEQKIFNGADLKGTDPPDNSQVDYRIFWYGNCDMWIQRVRVENNWANELFSDLYIQTGTNWIQWEVQNIAGQIGNKAYKFLLDESEYNMYPAIGYLNQKINSFKSQGSKLSAIALHNIVMMTPEQNPLWTDTMRIEDIDTVFRNSGMNEVFTDVYPIYADSVNMRYYGKRQYVPNTLPESDYNIRDGRLGKPAEPFLYERNLNENIDHIGHRYIEFNQNANYLSRTYNVPYVAAIQIHSWYNGSEDLYSLREPTNQEIEMLAGIALTYGAKGIIYHAYNSIDKTNAEHNQYSRGLVGDYTEQVPDSSMCNGGKRYRNAYGQYKWNFVYNLTAKLKNLGKTIIKFKNTDSYGYRYHNPVERSSMIGSSFIQKIVTFRDFGPISNCTEMNTPTNMIAECQDDTYLQIGTFKTAEPHDRYLMVVNRRTSPDSLSAITGKRLLRIITKENSSELAGFNNWKIIDVESNSDVAVFNKSELSTIDVGWINPGEIKLYKLAPVMQEGGTLVCDENIGNLSSFDCKDMVSGNGHNITIGQGVTINFADTAGIEMQNGNFLCGNDNTFGSTQVTLKPKVPSAGWNGVSVTNGGITYIYNTIFENPKAGEYSITLANCSDIKVKYCTFNNNSDMINSGGILITVFTNSEPVPSYISNNLFVMKGSNLPALNINSSAGSSTNPVTVEYNTFSTVTSSLEAISFTNVSGGEIKNNSITNYEKGIKLIASSTDIFGNNITSNLANASGIEGYDTEMVIGSSGSYFIGGLNNIILTGNNSNSIRMTNSYFNVDFGKNTFDIPNTTSLMHWTGYFPEDMQTTEIIYTRKNCFKINGSNDTARHDITIGYGGETANIVFEEYDCGSEMPEDYEVITQSDGYQDTIYINTGGEGASGRDKMINKKTELTSGKSGKAEIVTYKSLKDTITILIRRRDFQQAEQKIKQMLTTFSDSSYAVNTPGLLFYCVSQQDTNTENLQQTKTFYETAIQNNQGKPELLKRLFYYIQKCKVRLGQYSSALEGFLYIMQNNQYNMLGLIASWDYAATQLLMGSGGMGPEGLGPEEINDSIRFSKKVELTKIRDGYDEKKFTKEDRKKIITNIETAMEYEKKRDETKLEKMKEKLKGRQKDEKNKENPNDDTGNTENQLEREIQKIEKIKETVKIKKPKTEKEYIEIMNKDMIKVFGSELKKESLTRNKTEIPTSYELRQNYPNPFNSMTNVQFQMINAGRVKLVVYDILGREVKILVNEIRQAGIHKEIFDAGNLSSGVYFLRILVNDGKDFSDVKKMVLVR